MYKNSSIFFLLYSFIILLSSCDRKTNDWLGDLNRSIPIEKFTLIVNNDTIHNAHARIQAIYPDEGTLTIYNGFSETEKINLQITLTNNDDRRYQFDGKSSFSSIYDLVTTRFSYLGTINADNEVAVNIEKEWEGPIINSWQPCNAIFRETETNKILFSGGFTEWMSSYHQTDNSSKNLAEMSSLALHAYSNCIFKEFKFNKDGTVSLCYRKNPGLTASLLIQAAFDGSYPTFENKNWISIDPNRVRWYIKKDSLYLQPDVQTLCEISNNLLNTTLETKEAEQFFADAQTQDLDESMSKLKVLAKKWNLPLLTDSLNTVQTQTIIDCFNKGIHLSINIAEANIGNQNKRFLTLYVTKKIVDLFAYNYLERLPKIEQALKETTINLPEQKMNGWDFFLIQTNFQTIDEYKNLWEKTSLFDIGFTLISDDKPTTNS